MIAPCDTILGPVAITCNSGCVALLGCMLLRFVLCCIVLPCYEQCDNTLCYHKFLSCCSSLLIANTQLVCSAVDNLVTRCVIIICGMSLCVCVRCVVLCCVVCVVCRPAFVLCCFVVCRCVLCCVVLCCFALMCHVVLLCLSVLCLHVPYVLLAKCCVVLCGVALL